ncbi:hypothetical protein V2J09_023403 [Rumex salicifolius]
MVKGQGERVRLYVRGSILGYKRSKSNQYPSTSLIQIEGVNTKEEVAWYAGKKMAYIYKAKTKKNGSHYRCIWGKVSRPHGNTGVVRAKFKSNLPPKSMFDHPNSECLRSSSAPVSIFTFESSWVSVSMSSGISTTSDSRAVVGFKSDDIIGGGAPEDFRHVADVDSHGVAAIAAEVLETLGPEEEGNKRHVAGIHCLERESGGGAVEICVSN